MSRISSEEISSSALSSSESSYSNRSKRKRKRVFKKKRKRRKSSSTSKSSRSSKRHKRSSKRQKKRKTYKSRYRSMKRKVKKKVKNKMTKLKKLFKRGSHKSETDGSLNEDEKAALHAMEIAVSVEKSTTQSSPKERAKRLFEKIKNRLSPKIKNFFETFKAKGLPRAKHYVANLISLFTELKRKFNERQKKKEEYVHDVLAKLCRRNCMKLALERVNKEPRTESEVFRKLWKMAIFDPSAPPQEPEAYDLPVEQFDLQKGTFETFGKSDSCKSFLRDFWYFLIYDDNKNKDPQTPVMPKTVGFKSAPANLSSNQQPRSLPPPMSPVQMNKTQSIVIKCDDNSAATKSHLLIQFDDQPPPGPR